MQDCSNIKLLHIKEISIFLQPFGKEFKMVVLRMIYFASTMNILLYTNKRKLKPNT